MVKPNWRLAVIAQAKTSSGSAGKLIIVALALLVLTMSTGPAHADTRAGVASWLAGDFPEAVRQWVGPARAGDRDAAFNLGQAYKLGRGVPQDNGIAAEWYGRAAAAGHTQAQTQLGLYLFRTGQREIALRWLQRAADQGEPRAQYVMGTAFFNGDTLPKDWTKAYAFMTCANAQGIGAASASLAKMDGLIPQSQREAARGLPCIVYQTAAADPAPSYNAEREADALAENEQKEQAQAQNEAVTNILLQGMAGIVGDLQNKAAGRRAAATAIPPVRSGSTQSTYPVSGQSAPNIMQPKAEKRTYESAGICGRYEPATDRETESIRNICQQDVMLYWCDARKPSQNPAANGCDGIAVFNQRNLFHPNDVHIARPTNGRILACRWEDTDWPEQGRCVEYQGRQVQRSGAAQ